MWPPAGWLLAGVVFPLLVLAGVADWACHRATGIARTSGLRENLLHWVMFAELGVGVLAAALLEVNAGVLLLLAVLAWDQVLAIAGHGAADWSLRWKARPLPAALLLAGAAVTTLCNVALLAQETAACLAARRTA